ncbi:MAG: response regulator [Crocinitomicaceae bacterium]|jgi:two-component system chemotaxis sensor kinase CheA
MLKGKTVVIVDDNLANVFALKAVLKPFGCNILTAINGRECLDVLKKSSQVDIILLDMMMPVMDGYETIKEIRKNPVTWQIPIVSLTAQAMETDVKRCLNAGANGYCSKPINIDNLMKIISSVLL